MNKQPIEPLSVDGLPREVSAEFLASTTAHLSNRFRKNCCASRVTVYFSPTPLTRPDPAGPLFVDLDAPGKSEPEVVQRKLSRKMRVLSLKQLGQLARRSEYRRVQCARAFEKLVNVDTKQARSLRAVLSERHETFQTLADSAAAEIRRRTRTM